MSIAEHEEFKPVSIKVFDPYYIINKRLQQHVGRLKDRRVCS